jgi:hypothetical protein
MNKDEIRRIVFKCNSYSEFKMKLSLLGITGFPSKNSVNYAAEEDWSWYKFTSLVSDAISSGETDISWIYVRKHGIFVYFEDTRKTTRDVSELDKFYDEICGET